MLLARSLERTPEADRVAQRREWLEDVELAPLRRVESDRALLAEGPAAAGSPDGKCVSTTQGTVSPADYRQDACHSHRSQCERGRLWNTGRGKGGRDVAVLNSRSAGEGLARPAYIDVEERVVTGRVNC